MAQARLWEELGQRPGRHRDAHGWALFLIGKRAGTLIGRCVCLPPHLL